MKSRIDLNSWDKRLKSAERDLKSSGIPAGDKKLILQFSNYKKISENVGAGRRVKYVHNLMVFSKRLNQLTGKDFKSAGKKDIEAAVSDLYSNSVEWNLRNGHELSKNTIRVYLVILKTFDSWLKKEDNPKTTVWIKPPRIDPKRLKPNEIIMWEDAVTLSRAALNHRDKALPLVLWESGARIGEILCMNIEDVEVLDNGMVLHILESKTEKRDVGIKKSYLALGEWMNNHPLSGQEDAPLWVNIRSNNERMTASLVRRIFEREAARCNLKKDVNPHRFRKSHASIFATNGMFTEAELKRRMGWSPDSSMLKIYVHIDDYRINQKYLNSGQEGIPCMWCNAVNSPAETYCQTCKRPLDDDLTEKKNDLERMVEELIERKLNAMP